MGGTPAQAVTSRSHAIITVALVASSALHGAMVVHAFRETDAALVVGALTSAALAWAALRWSLRATLPLVAWPLLAILGGACNAWLAWFLLSFAERGVAGIVDPGLAGVLIIGGVIGAFCAVPFTAMGFVLVLPAQGARERPTTERPWSAMLIAGLWSVSSALLAHASPLRGGEALLVAPATLVVGAAGLAAALAGALVLARRAHWLARVRRGRVPGWAVVRGMELPPAAPAHASDLLPWSDGGTGEAMLVRERRVSAGAYRDATSREPVAWV